MHPSRSPTQQQAQWSAVSAHLKARFAALPDCDRPENQRANRLRPMCVAFQPMSSNRGGLPPSEELMALETYRRGRAVVIAVSGEVDVLTAPELRRALDDALRTVSTEPGAVVVDLEHVSFLASRGLSTLVDAHREAAAGIPLRVVVDHARPVIRPIQLSGLDAVLTLFDTVDDALVGRPEVDVATER